MDYLIFHPDDLIQNLLCHVIVIVLVDHIFRGGLYLGTKQYDRQRAAGQHAQPHHASDTHRNIKIIDKPGKYR